MRYTKWVADWKEENNWKRPVKDFHSDLNSYAFDLEKLAKHFKQNGIDVQNHDQVWLVLIMLLVSYYYFSCIIIPSHNAKMKTVNPFIIKCITAVL